MSGPMGLVLPNPGDTTDTWGTVLNTLLGLVENHDHTTGKGSKIPSAALNVNADIAFAGFALTGAKAFTFSEVATSSMTSYSDALFVDNSSHNLFFRNSVGTNVQITAGNQLDLSAVAGIGGDYAAVSALIDFTDATHAYGLHQQIGGGVRQYGKLWTGDVSLFEFKANPATGVPANAVTLKSPNSLAASYTYTFPSALPTSTAPLTVDNTGAVTNGSAFTLTANAGITISGTATYKHGTKIRRHSVQLADLTTSSAVTATPGTQGVTLPNNANVWVRVPMIAMHERWVTVELWFSSTGDASACTCELFHSSGANPETGTLSTLSTFLTPGGTAVATANISRSPSNAEQLWIKVTNSVTTPKITAVGIQYDAP